MTHIKLDKLMDQAIAKDDTAIKIEAAYRYEERLAILCPDPAIEPTPEQKAIAQREVNEFKLLAYLEYERQAHIQEHEGKPYDPETLRAYNAPDT